MRKSILCVLFIFSFSQLGFSSSRPLAYTALLDYVQPAPDQGETAICMFMASTGAVELLANKKNKIRHPVYNGPFDLSESYLIYAPDISDAYEKPERQRAVLRFNSGFGIHNSDWPFDAWVGNQINNQVWSWRDTSQMKRVSVPQVETIDLFSFSNIYATHVLNDSHIELIKNALWDYQSPVVVNYVDDNFWHMILIVGFDDNLPGECYELRPEDCKTTPGAFYIRDSFGVPIEIRDYDWFKIMGNAAFVVKEK
jgi:C1A family cysteine protease